MVQKEHVWNVAITGYVLAENKTMRKKIMILRRFIEPDVKTFELYITGTKIRMTFHSEHSHPVRTIRTYSTVGSFGI